ncbi:hypothetical protein [Streptacidiphilus sp. EB129]|uniref:hypothetical protein n=1 Tax=Streptacidiphilus sp. EB129 TaxID=3156262 RepID=UPI0035143ADB
MSEQMDAFWKQAEALDTLALVEMADGWPTADTVYLGYPHKVMALVDPWDDVRYGLLRHAAHVDHLAIANPADEELEGIAIAAAGLLVSYDTEYETGVGPESAEDVGEFEVDDNLGYLRQEYHHWRLALLD